MTVTRPPAVAGLFYPAAAESLRAAVRAHLGSAGPDEHLGRPKGLIVPHAGYRYSGAAAGAAYRRVMPLRGSVSRVVLVGPAHYVPLDVMAVPSAAALGTPLGALAVDRAAVLEVLALPDVTVSDAAHSVEHSLEVQLPFIVEALGVVSVVPIVVGDVSPSAVGRALELLWAGPETVIVVSSDLSHFHSSAVARQLDGQTADAIARMDPAAIDAEHACGWSALRGFLWAARRHDLRCQTVALTDSSQEAGRPESVVGYGAFVFRERSEPGPT